MTTDAPTPRTCIHSLLDRDCPACWERYCADLGRALAAKEADMARLVELHTGLVTAMKAELAQCRKALRKAIEEADGCHDDEYGTPSPNLDAERALLNAAIDEGRKE